MATRFLVRRDRAVNWSTDNPVLAQGEMGLEIDTKNWKMGDGITPWNALGYREDYAPIYQALSQKLGVNQLGVANGIATLDASGKLPLVMIPDGITAGPGGGGGLSLDTDGRPYFDADGLGEVRTDSDGRPYFDFGA
jgi:hypothetical protein